MAFVRCSGTATGANPTVSALTVQAGDYVVVSVFAFGAAATPPAPWLTLRGQRTGAPPYYSTATVSFWDGFAPAGFESLSWVDAGAYRVALLAFGDARDPTYRSSVGVSDFDAVQLTQESFVLFLEAFVVSAHYSYGQSGAVVDRVTASAGDSTIYATVNIFSYPAGDTGAFAPGPSISNMWSVGMAIVLPTIGGTTPPSLDSPVTLRFSESLAGSFADPSIDATFFSQVDLPVGSRYAIGDQLGSDNWYSFTVRDKSVSGGLSSYTGETLLAMLSRIMPRESLVLVAGEDGVPAQLDLRECLRRFLVFYGVPFVDDLPAFFLRAGDEIVAPEVDAFVIQPNQETPESLYEWLQRFFGPFRGYTFRADADDKLVVTPPPWLDTIGLRLTVYRRRQPLDGVPIRDTVRAAWSTARAPTVEWGGSGGGVAVSGSLPTPLVLSATAITVTVGGVDVRVSWDPGFVQVMVWPIPDGDVSVGSLYSVTFVFRPDGAGSDVLDLTDDDVGPGEVITTSSESVINQAIVRVRRREFTPSQQVMQAAALVLRSPSQVMAGGFGNNAEYGPMSDDLATPGAFLELANLAEQSGAWFWPADPLVVAQPGGNITVAFDVDEWAEQWRSPSAPYAAAASVNTWSDSADLPTSGEEVKLFDFQFPRQTTNFAPSPYGAQGSVYGRWRGGEQPGIDVRVGNSRFAEFGFLVEVGPIFGQTTYFLWGAIVKLNGTGVAFTDGVLETYRFGFARSEAGLWEGDPSVPALAESQMLYPNRSDTAPELPYTVSPETALAIARGIVEENLAPKSVYHLPVVPSTANGWVARPSHLGRAGRVVGAGLSVAGRVVAIDYEEAHTAGGSNSGVTVEIEAASVPTGSRAVNAHYAQAAYGISHYQVED